MMFDKKIIKSNFNKYSKNYNSKANLQKIIANQLCEFAKFEVQNSQNILDLGCGTGFIGQNLLKNYDFSNKELFQLDIAQKMFDNNPNKGSNIFNIQADIENLPFKNGKKFDLILSSLAFQWLNNLNFALKNIKNILKPNSKLVFSIFIDGTLCELKQSAKEIGVNLSINNFIKEEELNQIIAQNFKDYQIEIVDFKEEYKDIYELLNSIKQIGASYSVKERNILTKQDFKDLNNFYLKNFNNHDRIVAGWKVAYIKSFSN